MSKQGVLFGAVGYSTGLNAGPEEQCRLCSQLRQVNGSGRVEWVVEDTLQVAQVPVG